MVTSSLAVAAVAVAAWWVVGNRGARSAIPSATHRARRPVIPPGPIPGYLLIADRGNDRLLLVDGRKRVIWRYPGSGEPPAAPFRFDDDAFFAPGHRDIITNQEDQDTIEILSFPAGKLVWRYGHYNVHSGAPGYLYTPDDAYLLPNGLRSVADAYNCRVLFVDAAHRIVRMIGSTGDCHHDPPRAIGAPNGATPLPNGDTLISEIAGSWIDDVTRSGRLRWAFQAPVVYPSDPQPLPGGRILLADYTRPGHVLIVNHQGRVLWRYGPASGPGALDHPSLALPIGHGLIAVNDDYRDRVLLIDIATKRIVWQYGHTDAKGTGPGYLNTPDGMDLLPTNVAEHSKTIQTLIRGALRPPSSSTPNAAAAGPTFARLHDLPGPVQRAVAVGVSGRVLIAGGLDTAQQSTGGVFSLNPATGRLVSLGVVPQPFHDAAAAVIRNRLFIFGWGAAVSTSTVQAFNLRTRRGTIVGRLPHALSDLVAARIGSIVYLVGGYNGVTAQTAVWSTTDGMHFRHVATLPIGLRYPAVAAVGGRLVVAGGQTQTGLSASVYTVDPLRGTVRPLGVMSEPVGQAAAIAIGSTVYVIGGRDAAGAAVRNVTAVDVARRRVRSVAQLRSGLADAAIASIGSTWYLVGGWRGANLPQVLATTGG